MLLKEGLPYLDMSICGQETFRDWRVGLQCGWIYCTKFVEYLPINSLLRNLTFSRGPSELQDILLIKSTQLFLSTFLLRFNSNILVLFASFQSFPHFFSGTMGRGAAPFNFLRFLLCFQGLTPWESLMKVSRHGHGMAWLCSKFTGVPNTSAT